MNRITEKLRKSLDIESADPREYMPLITNEMLMIRHSVDVLKVFEAPLEHIFQCFDFEFSSYTPANKQFLDLRKAMLRLHGLMVRNIAGNMNPVVVTVFSRLISLATAFFGYINS